MDADCDGIARVLVLNDEILSGVAEGIKARREAEESGVLQRTGAALRIQRVECTALPPLGQGKT